MGGERHCNRSTDKQHREDNEEKHTSEQRGNHKRYHRDHRDASSH